MGVPAWIALTQRSEYLTFFYGELSFIQCALDDRKFNSSPPSQRAGNSINSVEERSCSRENWSQPTYILERIVVLQEILFGHFTPPTVKSRVFKIGFASCERYVPPKVREYKRQEPNKPETLIGSNKRVYDIVKRCKDPVTAADIEKKAKYTRNHCSIVLSSLFKLGLLTRKKIHSNGTRYFLYQVKESESA